MKIRLVALVGSAISLAFPTFAQQKDTVDPQIAQQIRVLAMKFDDAFNKNDATALAALYTKDAVWVTPQGTFSGPRAIEKHYAQYQFQQKHSSNHVLKVDRVIAVDNEVRATGTWIDTFQETGGSTKHIDGLYSWVLVREGDTWKIRRNTYDESRPY